MALTLGLLMPAVSRAADPPIASEKQEIANRPKIAIADFRGADVETSRFLAETIISNLAASRTLKPLDRPTVRRAIVAELTEPDAEPTQEEIVSTGKRLHSAYFVTGSYLIQEDKILLLAHIHTIKDEEAPTIQLRCTGDRAQIMDVAKQLSDQIESQLTPREEVHPVREEAPAPREEVRPVVRPVPHPTVIPTVALPDPMAALRASGLCPNGINSGANLSEADLARLLGRLEETAAVHASFTLSHNNTPAPRMLALTGLVKLMLTPEEIADYRQKPPANLPSDFAHVPLWGQPFLAAAVDRGWWDGSKEFRPGVNTNWAFIAIVACKMGIIELPHEVMKVEPVHDVKPAPAIDDDNAIYTGLVVDGRDFKVERSQSPSILDEDGNFVYPFEEHAPSAAYIGENGMADYNFDVGDQTRAGKHPLVVHAIKVAGPFHDDLVVTNEDAERIRKAQKRSPFLWKWKVVFLIPNN
jgi:TolB-like protein